MFSRRATTRATQRRAFQKRINFAINVTTASCDRFTDREREEREKEVDYREFSSTSNRGGSNFVLRRTMMMESRMGRVTGR